MAASLISYYYYAYIVTQVGGKLNIKNVLGFTIQ